MKMKHKLNVLYFLQIIIIISTKEYSKKKPKNQLTNPIRNESIYKKTLNLYLFDNILYA